jgi:hypothetical protein
MIVRFLRTAYEVHPDYNGAILGKAGFIVGQIWYYFHIPHFSC